MKLQNPFSALGPTGIDSQLLTVLARTTRVLSAAEIHRLLPEQGSLRAVHDGLRRLEAHGVLQGHSIGRSVGYQLNRDHVLAPAVALIADAKMEVFRRLRAMAAAWEVQPVVMYVFGSTARDDMRTDSDIDLLVVFPDGAPDDIVENQLSALSEGVWAWTGNEPRPLLLRVSEVTPSGVMESVEREGAIVVGDPQWLRRRLRALA
ncbi:nucleotidyltransferase domain-containing protein [Corynebacterium sp.]|uniref:nucleotidyltransferase domain-containing protein n=1 Tax=Corynebacterium sp. TaxID=1720 RepID=UPI0026E109FF|nr:nucleotidyltransferase domain-containing protein [Corynebacterium sp.]MDO5513072.1 nucleotidyltransferase domain-containing protein [Corynebacterium sp.]